MSNSNDNEANGATAVSSYRLRLATRSAGATDAEVKEEFARLVRVWQDERGISSNMVRMFLLPSYQRIIGLGPAALPLIFEEMQGTQDFWFWALRAIRD